MDVSMIPQKASESSTGGLPRFGEATPKDRLRQLHKTHDVWKFGPLWYLPLAFLPFIVAW